MNCIELNILGKSFRIIRYGELSESGAGLSASDFDLLEQFFFTGVLPDGFYLEKQSEDGNQVLTNDDINKLISDLRERYETDNNEKSERAVNENDFKHFVDTVIGNRVYKFDDDVIPQRNILYNASWGENKTQYGFTENRFVIFTGNKFLSNGNSNIDKLNIIYKTIKDNRKSSYVKLINAIYAKYNKNVKGVDIMSKLTWVSNNRLNELLSHVISVDEPFSIQGVENKQLLENHEEIVLGKYFRTGSDVCVIVNNDKSLGDFVDVKIINSDSPNTIVRININRIRNLYSPKVYT